MLGSSRPWWIWLLPGANLVAAAKLGSLSLFRFLLAVFLFMVGWSILRATVDVDIAFGIFRLGGLWIIFASLIYGAVVLSEWFRGIGKLVGRPYSVLVWGWIAPVLLALLFLLASVVGGAFVGDGTGVRRIDDGICMAVFDLARGICSIVLYISYW